MNLLNIIENEGLPLKKVGTEYQGPCPFCKDGTDRFHIHPEKGENGTYWCRVCGVKGDAIQFLKDFKGMGYREACEYLGQAPKDMERKDKRRPRTPGEVPPAKETVEPFEPRECTAPAELWQERAEGLVECAHQTLPRPSIPLLNKEGSPEGGVVEWLAARGIFLDTIKRFRLGWNPGENGKDIYRSRSVWGLPEEKKADGKLKKVWVPVGLVIPCLVDGKLARIRIRRPVVKEGEDRFIVVPGGYTGPMVIKFHPHPSPLPEGEGGIKGWVIVESELDAILIAQKVGDVVGVMAMGNNIARPDGPAFKMLKDSLCILNAMDYDQGGAAARKWWEENFSQCKRWPVPKAKDPGDYYKEGGNIKEWVMAGLPPVFKVGAALAPPCANVGAANLGAASSAPTEAKYTIIEAADGRKVYITDDKAEYARLQREKKIVFNSKELPLIDPAAAERAMDAKEIWDKAEVVEPMAVGAVLAPPACLIPPGQSQGLPLQRQAV